MAETKVQRISRGRYRFGAYDIVQTGSRRWEVVWGDTGFIRSGLILGAHPTLKEAIAYIRSEEP